MTFLSQRPGPTLKAAVSPPQVKDAITFFLERRQAFSLAKALANISFKDDHEIRPFNK